MQTKHEFLRRTAAVIAAFFTLTFTSCGQTPESPGSFPVSGVVSETTAQRSGDGWRIGRRQLYNPLYRCRAGRFHPHHLRWALDAH